MQQSAHRPRIRARKLTCFGLSGASLVAAHLLFAVPALACGNAMRMVTPGVMFWLVVAWLGAGAISMIVVYYDGRKWEPLSTTNRRLVILAIFAALTLARLIHYGATVDVEEWRLFDLMESTSFPMAVDGPEQVTF